MGVVLLLPILETDGKWLGWEESHTQSVTAFACCCFCRWLLTHQVASVSRAGRLQGSRSLPSAIFHILLKFSPSLPCRALCPVLV